MPALIDLRMVKRGDQNLRRQQMCPNCYVQCREPTKFSSSQAFRAAGPTVTFVSEFWRLRRLGDGIATHSHEATLLRKRESARLKENGGLQSTAGDEATP